MRELRPAPNARSDAARRGWQTRRARIESTLGAVREIADQLRETATQLRNHLKPDGLPGVRIHPAHAANRLMQLAGQLSSSKRGTPK